MVKTPPMQLRDNLAILRRLALGALLIVVTACAPIASAQQDPLKILFITGGGFHDFDAQRDILTKGLAERLQVQFTIDHEAGSDATAVPERFSDPDWVKGYDLVLYNISLSVDQKPETAQAIIDSHVKHGVPAALLHGSTHSYRRTGNQEWFNFLGARSMKHDARRPFANEVLEPNHPVMVGFPDPWQQAQGELYIIEEMFPAAQPLARAHSVETETDQPTIWINNYKGIRIFVTTIGHHNETMASETYLDLVSRGILWATGATGE